MFSLEDVGDFGSGLLRLLFLVVLMGDFGIFLMGDLRFRCGGGCFCEMKDMVLVLVLMCVVGLFLVFCFGFGE